jgi:hypothetical protein
MKAMADSMNLFSIGRYYVLGLLYRVFFFLISPRTTHVKRKI